jgi:hypothetical protein
LAAYPKAAAGNATASEMQKAMEPKIAVKYLILRSVSRFWSGRKDIILEEVASIYFKSH